MGIQTTEMVALTRKQSLAASWMELSKSRCLMVEVVEIVLRSQY